eukprot:g3748.t1
MSSTFHEYNAFGAASPSTSYMNDFAVHLQGASAGMNDLSLASDGQPVVLLMGPKRSGKSSIQRVVFHKMSPHETLFLEPTSSLEIIPVANNPFVNLQLWDTPGDYLSRDQRSTSPYESQTLSDDVIFGKCGALVYVVDAQDEMYTDTITTLVDTFTRAYKVNPDIFFEVFVHKVDGDPFISGNGNRDGYVRDVQQKIQQELDAANLDVDCQYHLTSIYDHTVFESFSKVVQKLISELPALERLMDALVENCAFEKTFLFDVVSKIFVATDSNPVDSETYELCSDMIDVVTDVSCIYGAVGEDGGFLDSLGYDEKSASTIRLQGGMYNNMVLYLRQVSSFLAIVCIMPAASYEKAGLIDYNIDCFKLALEAVCEVKRMATENEERRKA